MHDVIRTHLLPLCLLALLAPAALAEDASADSPALAADVKARARKAIDKGLDYLRAAWDEQRAAAGDSKELTHWGHPGLTALALTAFYRSPRNYRNEDGPFLREPFEYLLSIQRENGAINDQDGLDNYITSVAMMALLSSREDVKDVLDKAAAFMTKEQLDEGEGYKPGDKYYGGQGYGSSQRPDLSNTQLAVEALHQYGLPKDSEFFKRALVFISRCQNSSETNDLDVFSGEDGESYVPGNDGGFIYTVGRSEALEAIETMPDGSKSLRSYGSMTYAAIKAMIHAGLDDSDPRMKSALEWIKANYQVDENPGAGKQGLYYYLHTFAKTLNAAGIDEVTDAEGESHDWRTDLVDALVSRQRSDGSWVNDTGRWMESNPVLVTSYSVLALEELLGH